MKKLKISPNFTQFQLYFTQLLLLKSFFREERVKKQQFWKVLQDKITKNQEKNFGLAFDPGLKSFLDSPGKKSYIHLCRKLSQEISAHFKARRFYKPACLFSRKIFMLLFGTALSNLRNGDKDIINASKSTCISKLLAGIPQDVPSGLCLDSTKGNLKIVSVYPFDCKQGGQAGQ